MTVLIPTLRRAQRIAPIVANLRAVSPQVRVVFVVEEQESYDAATKAGAEAVWNTRAKSYAGAINSGFEQTDGEWVFTGADDLEWREGWLSALAPLMKQYSVMGTNDLHADHVMRGDDATHMAVKREYINALGGTASFEPGRVMWEGYEHYFCDPELVNMARWRGVWSPCLESHVAHFPERENGDEKMDANLSAREADKAKYKRRSGVWEQDPIKCLKHKIPFAYTRWGDGEWNAAMQLRPGKANCDKHLFYPDMGAELTRIIKGKPDYMIGLQPLARRLLGDKIERFAGSHNWTTSEHFHNAARRNDWAFLDYIRAMRLAIVGPAHLAKAFPNVLHFVVPDQNCWKVGDEVMRWCRRKAKGQTCFVFCASMASNVWIDRLWGEFKGKHLFVDAGSVFDPLCGVESRKYMKGKANDKD